MLQMGIARDAFVQQDGSGLSRRDLINADTLVALLQSMQHTVLPQILPVGGESGTLLTRYSHVAFSLLCEPPPPTCECDEALMH